MGPRPRSLALLLLALLPLALPPPAAARALSYREAVSRAVQRLNRLSSDANLFRLLSLDSGPPEDEDPDTPKPVSFTTKETVCPKATQLPLEQCDFKKDGRVERCVGTVTLDPARDVLAIACNRVQRVRRMALVGGFFRKARRKLGKTFRKIGKKIKDVLKKLPRPQPIPPYPYGK